MRMINTLVGIGAFSAACSLGVARAQDAAATTPATVAPAPAAEADLANDGLADELDDVLKGPDPGSESTGSEQSVDEEPAATPAPIALDEDGKRKKTVIKTLARKNFLKLGRFEASPHAAFVANDPFLNRYIVGTGFGYHITEVFAVETSIDFAPDLGEGDWKPLTTQLVTENNVSPDISKLTLFGAATFQYSPIYGKVAVVGRNIVNFDVYGAFGMGFTRTTDDLTALGAEDDPRAQITQFQTHPTTNFGGGLRIIFGESIAARVEARSLVYIETVNATTLEMKNNLILQGAVSFFFPNMK
jgi:outer membrane beta-barrel protein